MMHGDGIGSGIPTSGGFSNPAAPSHAGVCELRPEASTTRSVASWRPSLSCTPAVPHANLEYSTQVSQDAARLASTLQQHYAPLRKHGQLVVRQ
jgi:hypothetical protein